MTEDIYLAGGCFRGTEHYIKQIDGVTDTEVEFANGQTHKNPQGYCHLPAELFEMARKARRQTIFSPSIFRQRLRMPASPDGRCGLRYAGGIRYSPRYRPCLARADGPA
ncbi:MAG: peptide-methionine (S)-S-oxide reductase [Bacteroidales bacterium]|nr:peptide-methionine (S)-S-oxide reductase [Bacteroidales bacterium]